jgi:predicted SAM-dependent methyltransferase
MEIDMRGIGMIMRRMARGHITIVMVVVMRDIGKRVKCMVKVIQYFNALGVYHYTNGEKYDGDWVNGEKSGHGNFFI